VLNEVTDGRPHLGVGAAARAAVLVGAAFLLLTFGGAIFAAPLALPLLAWTARRTPSRALRALAVVVAALTAGETGWAATYVTLGEGQPWILLLPIVAGVAAGTTVFRWARR
jgi:hypothetical protein